MIEFLKSIRRKFIKFKEIQKIHFGESIFILKNRGGTIADALLLCHALEKGMGISNVKEGYGKEKATKLLEKMIELQANYPDSYVYAESYAIIRAYIDYQKSQNTNVSHIEKTLSYFNFPLMYCDAGVKYIKKNELLKGTVCNFKDLVTSKHSMRKSSDLPITEKEMKDAISLTCTAPSACNRQPCKIYYSLETDKNISMSKLVPGNKLFYEDIKYYCLVTADKSLFGGSESYQWYLNSGIFISYFTLALHSLGIGSCIFQWPDYYEKEKEMRQLIGEISNEESIVAVIGYGHYPNELKCISAQRKPIEEIAKKF